MFADDTTLYIKVDQPDSVAHNLNSHLKLIPLSSKDWLVKFNPNNTEDNSAPEKSIISII